MKGQRGIPRNQSAVIGALFVGHVGAETRGDKEGGEVWYPATEMAPCEVLLDENTRRKAPRQLRSVKKR